MTSKWRTGLFGRGLRRSGERGGTSNIQAREARGAIVGGSLGLISSVAMVVLSKAFWETSLHLPAPLPYSNPAIFSMPIAFIGIVVVSLIDKSARAKAEQAAFDAQYVRSETGIGALGATAH